MSWVRYGACFRLQEPVHVGYLPSITGVTVTARSRYYVPARNFWGALTVVMAHRDADPRTPAPSQYKRWSERIRSEARFSHFFAADEAGYYAPRYDAPTENPRLRTLLHAEPLRFGAYDRSWDHCLPREEFRHRFVGSRMSAKLNVETGAADESMLHETEFILHLQRRDAGGSRGAPPRPVFVVGAWWLREDLANDLMISVETIGGNPWIAPSDGFSGRELLIGGDRCYGFGHVTLVRPPQATTGLIDYLPAEPEGFVWPALRPPVLPMPMDARVAALSGDRELLVSRSTQLSDDDHAAAQPPGRQVQTHGECYSPGSVLPVGFSAPLSVDADGILRSFGGR